MTSQHAPPASDAGDGQVETRGPSQGGAVDASSARRAQSETRGSSQGGAVDASSVPIGEAESDLSAASTSGTDQGNRDGPRVVTLMVYVAFFPW